MILDRFRVDGQVALVTGASRGIGLGIAEALAEAGARLFVSSRTARPEAVERLRRIGGEVTYVEADMADPAAPAWLVEQVVAPVRGQRSSSARARAGTLAAELGELCTQMHTALVRAAIADLEG